MLGELESTADKDADKYKKIWEAFGPVLKEGLYEDHERRAQLLGLCRFATSASDEPRSLKQYVADLKPNQTEIYYLVGESLERLKANPKLEAAKARGIEVLLLADPIDAFWTIMPCDWEGKPLKSLSQGDIDFSLVPLLDKDAPPAEASEADKDVLEGGEGRARRAGLRGARLAAPDRQPGLPGRRGAARATASSNGCSPARSAAAAPSRCSSSTCATPSCRRSPARSGSKKESDVADLSAVLLAQAQILDGEVPTDPAAFARRLNELIVRGLRT